MVDIVDRETGEVVNAGDVEFAYTREGRRVVGKEYPNPVPMEPPIGYVPSKPIYEQIREMVQLELSKRAEADGEETFEEADDFDVGDDYDPSSPYEMDFEPTDPWPPASRAVAEAEEKLVAGEGGAQPPTDQTEQAPAPASLDAPSTIVKNRKGDIVGSISTGNKPEPNKK